jgi:pSer/pThr/pTyr-binding forkhead associated (FHA) protein
MSARIFCKYGKFAGEQSKVKKELTIGRVASNDFVLDSGMISKKHARIFYDENQKCYFIEDLGSRAGTKVDGVKVTGPEKLGNLSLITLATQFDFIFQVVDAELFEKLDLEEKTTLDQEVIFAPQKIEQEALKDEVEVEVDKEAGDESKTQYDNEVIVAPHIIGQDETGSESSVSSDVHGKKLTDGTIFRLEFKTLNNSFDLKEGENLVGRTKDCGIRILHASLSRHHAILKVTSGKVILQDLESKNKTFVDGKEVDTEIEVRPNSTITFGSIVAELTIAD